MALIVGLVFCSLWIGGHSLAFSSDEPSGDNTLNQLDTTTQSTNRKYGVITGIEIQGNTKTQPQAILRELLFEQGAELTERSLRESEQAVKNMGLFKSVTLMPIRRNGDLYVQLIVEEKKYNFVLPKLGRSGDGDITTGIVWRSDNLFGLNQRSKFTVAYREFEDTDKKNEIEGKWEFEYPRIGESNYSFSLNIGREETNLEETVDHQTGVYERTRVYVEPFIGRWLRQDGSSRGIRATMGVLWQAYEHEYVSGTPGLLPNPTVKAGVVGFEGDFVQDRLLSRSGYHFGYRITYSGEGTDSDVDFLKQELFYRRYVPLKSVEHANLNLQIRAGHTTHSILGPPEFNIAGSKSLRGYARDNVEGNSFLLLNFEWLRPIFSRETLRGALTFDAGDAWHTDSDIQFSNLRYSAGIGLRWKIKRFVKTDIRLDISKGLSDGGETKVYLGTNATF